MTRENAIPAVQLPNGYDTISKYLDALIPFLQSNRHWWEYHSTNFLIEDFWDVSVPNEWKGPLMDLEYTELLHLASYGMTHEQKVRHSSFLNFDH